MAWPNRLWPLNLILFLGLAIAMVWNLLWQAPQDEELNAALFPSPLGEDFLNSLTQMTLNNAQGEFVMVQQREGQWGLTSPGEFPLDPDIFPKIRQSLGPWQIIKVYRRGPKLPSNTGLETPFATITLVGQDQTRKEVIWGLSNPLDQTTFIEIKGGPYVYLIKSSEFSLGPLGIEQLRVLGPWAHFKKGSELTQIVWTQQGRDLMIWNEQHPAFIKIQGLRAQASYAANSVEFKELEKVLRAHPGGMLKLTTASLGIQSFTISDALSRLRPARLDLPQGHLILGQAPGSELYLIDEKIFLDLTSEMLPVGGEEKSQPTDS